MALAIHQPASVLPFATKQSMSALEALAEVSRQHLDISSMRPPPPQSVRLPSPNGYSPDDFLVSDDKPAVDEDGHVSSGNPPSSATFVPLPPMQLNGHSTSNGSPRLPSLFFPSLTQAPSTHVVPSPLQLAASAANELLTPTGGTVGETDSLTNGSAHNRPFSPPRQNTDWSLDPLLQNALARSSPNGDHSGNRPVPLRRIAINPSASGSPQPGDSGTEQRTPKPKVRGRFTDSRRKEVQEVRKRGACIRCRMLKKPCSDGTPCTTCRNVESARLWKQPCIRTRVADEFDLYNAGLHAVLAFHQTNQAKALRAFMNTESKIVISHFSDFSISASYAAVTSPRQDQDTPASDSKDLIDVVPEIYMIDTNAGLDLVGEMQDYMQRLIPHIITSEPSYFMRATLQQASNMNSGDKKDSLIAYALELWIATAILTDPQLKFHLARTQPEAEPQSDHTNENKVPKRIPITDQDSLICIETQLNSIMEKRAVVTAKFVMNELERRLLQRQQASPFETFLVAVLLLSSTERMCWLFKTWEVSDADSSFDQSHTGNTTPSTAPNSHHQQHHPSSHSSLPSSDPLSPATPATPNSLTNGGIPESPTMLLGHPALPPSPRWPLDKPPSFYYQKGERFSDIVQMLLRMRGVPPKTTTQLAISGSVTGLCAPGENVLVGAGAPPSVSLGHAAFANGVPANEGPAAMRMTPQQAWFEKLGISMEEVQRRRERVWSREDGRCWEGKFVGKILGIV